MMKSPKFSPEVQDRAMRMVFDAKDQYPSQRAARRNRSRTTTGRGFAVCSVTSICECRGM